MGDRIGKTGASQGKIENKKYVQSADGQGFAKKRSVDFNNWHDSCY